VWDFAVSAAASWLPVARQGRQVVAGAGAGARASQGLPARRASQVLSAQHPASLAPQCWSQGVPRGIRRGRAVPGGAIVTPNSPLSGPSFSAMAANSASRALADVTDHVLFVEHGGGGVLIAGCVGGTRDGAQDSLGILELGNCSLQIAGLGQLKQPPRRAP